MTFNSVPAELNNAPSQINCRSQVRFKNEGEILLITLPAEAQTAKPTDWSVVWQELKYRLNSDRSWQPGSLVHLAASDHLLDGRQLQAVAEVLREANLLLKLVCTSRRQTAVAAAAAGYSVDQQLPPSPLGADQDELPVGLSDPLYLQTTVRSGIEVRHPGTVVLWGDINPGGTIVAAGDILVWGRLRGIAHAGAQGNREGKIVALSIEATQLRIADVVARAPATPPEEAEPEVAYLTPAGIRIARAVKFAKTHAFSPEVQGWLNSQKQPTANG